MSKTKKKIIIGLLLLIITAIIVTIFINVNMINSTKNQIVSLDETNKLTNVDMILVLGCKAYSDRPSLMLSKRLERGVDVYNKVHAKILLSGDYMENNYDEVNIMHDYVSKSGIKEDDIILDYYGFTTYDSIYRAKYVYNAKKIIVVTQKYHIYRALYLANKLDIEAVGIVADDIPQKIIMLKNEIREIFSRDKNYFKGIIKPKSKHLDNKNYVS